MEISRTYVDTDLMAQYSNDEPYMLQENILVGEGKAMLCDFGLAKRIAAVKTGLTAVGAPKYTPRYASPDLLSGQETADPLPRDVWAFGCVLWKVSRLQLHLPQ